MKNVRKGFFAAMPTVFSVMMGAAFCVILVLLGMEWPWFEQYYANRSLLGNAVLAPFAALGVAGLYVLSAKCGNTAQSHERRALWITRISFLLTLAAQLVVARSCWHRMGWDVQVVYTTAEELAMGLSRTWGADYFQLCPNNAPLTILQTGPIWLAHKLGLAEPFVVIPCIDAVLLNAAAYTGVRCVQTLTPNRAARGFALAVSIGWIALSPYIMYPYTDTFAILFPVLALYAYLKLEKPHVKWLVISLLCFFGASIKPTVLILLIALIMLEICRFFAKKDFSRQALMRVLAAAAALVIGMMPGKVFQDSTTRYLSGEATPQGQLCETHYLMLGMNEATYGGHSMGDVEFSTSYKTLDERRAANIAKAWERVSERSLMRNARFFAIKAYKAYADGSFASHTSFLELEVPKRTDALSTFLRSLYYEDGALMPYCQTLAQWLWLMLLVLCMIACFRMRLKPAVPLLALTLLGLTAYLLLFEVWPRYLFLYAPFFVILASLALEKPLSFKR